MHPLPEPAVLDRRILLSGPLNFRDLGGYAGAGGRRVRWRRVFRSDALVKVTPDDVAHLTDALGLLTIIDLRTAEEIDRYGRGALDSAGLSYHHVPILDETQVTTMPGRTLDDMYLLMLRSNGSQIAEVLHLLADDQGHPAVFHCAAGKDRTGIVAAVLLGLLGVAQEDVVEDYALTAEIMPTMIERWQASASARGERAEAPQHLFGAEPITMRHVLSVIDHEYGSIAGYATTLGIGDDVVDRLKVALLE